MEIDSGDYRICTCESLMRMREIIERKGIKTEPSAIGSRRLKTVTMGDDDIGDDSIRRKRRNNDKLQIYRLKPHRPENVNESHLVTFFVADFSRMAGGIEPSG